MKHKFYLFICVLMSVMFATSSCDDDWGHRGTARIHVTVRDGASHLEGETVYMFQSHHAPESLFFTPFYADASAVSDNYGEVTFDVEFHDDDAMFYFAVFDSDERYIEYVAVNVVDGATKSVELNLGGVRHSYYTLKSVVSQTLMTVHGVNYTGDANNRSFIAMQLPRNTERWFYAVSVSESQNITPTLKLYDGLSRYVDEQEGIVSDVISSFYVPAGNADCNVFFIKDDQNLNIFCDKSGTYDYFTEASRMNINSGLVDANIPANDGATWYLGIENPAPDNDIYVTVEVCALVWVEE